MTDAQIDSDEVEDLKALEEFVVHNDDLLELESEIGRFNIFDALKIARTEIRHSNFLSFILDPAESHGQGQLFLKAVLMDLLKEAPPGLRPLSPIDIDGVDLRGVEVRREWEHIDLFIACQEPRFCVVVENKVDAGEGKGALERYEKAKEASCPGVPTLYVYLTPDRGEASKKNWIPYSYADLYQVLSRVRKTYRNAVGEDVLTFLDHYLSLIGSRFMNDPKIDRLCQQIYKTHRRALRLIFDRAGNFGSEVLEAARSVLDNDARWHVFYQNNRRIAFVPKSWLEWLPPLGRDEDDESRSWLVLGLFLHANRMDFDVQVCKMADQKQRSEIVKRLIDKLPGLGFKNRRARVKNEEAPRTRVAGGDAFLKFPEEEEPDPETVRAAVKKKLDEVVPKLEGVPSLLKPMLKISN